MKGGACSFSVFCTWVRVYKCTFFCTNVCTYIHVRGPVRLRLRHLYTALDMTPLGWLGRKTSTQTNKAFVPGRILQFYSQVPHSGGIHVLWTHFWFKFSEKIRLDMFGILFSLMNKINFRMSFCYNLHSALTGLPLSGRTTYITPWDCHRTSKLNFKDVPRTSEISFVRPKLVTETSKNCQKARPLLTSCMMFASPTYRKFATCVDWALRTSHFPLAGVLLTAVSSIAAPFWWLRDHCMYLSRVLSWLIDVFIIKFSTATPKIFVEIIWSHYYF